MNSVDGRERDVKSVFFGTNGNGPVVHEFLGEGESWGRIRSRTRPLFRASHRLLRVSAVAMGLDPTTLVARENYTVVAKVDTDGEWGGRWMR